MDDIMSVSEPEACLHGYGERRMSIMNEVHDIMSVRDQKEDVRMYNEFGGTLSNLALAKHRKSRAINAENPRGEKGKGGMAASDLGPSRKGSPCLRDIASGQTVTLAEIEGPGAINHIWITVDAKTTDADCFVLRDLVLRMYWDDEEEPSVESPLGDFFCCGFGRECNVNSMPIAVVPSRGLNCYFQMPFRKKSKNHSGKPACQFNSSILLPGGLLPV